MFGNLVGITPPYNFETQKLKLTFLHECFVVFLFSLNLGVAFYFLIEKITTSYTNLHPVIVICQTLLFNTIAVTCNVMFLFSVLNRNKWKDFLGIFDEIDAKMNYVMHDRRLRLVLELFLGHVSLLAIVLYEGFKTNVFFYFDQYKYFMHIRIEYYVINIAVHLICKLTKSIEDRYVRFNVLLESIMENESEYHKMAEELDGQDFTRLWIRMQSMVDLFNKLFGWVILLLLGIATCSLLYTINLLIIFIIGGIGRIGSNGNMNEHYIIVSVLLTSLILVSTHRYNWRNVN